MRIEVLYFARLAQEVGERRATLELPAGATVGDAVRTLAARHTAIAALADRLAVAVNTEYAAATQVLADGDELALIPPVSGG